LRPRFLAKGRVGKGYRAIARNGRVLLASDRSLEELAGCVAVVRLQVWRRALLPGDVPKPYGLLLCIRSDANPGAEAAYLARLVLTPDPAAVLTLDVGGCWVLEFVSCQLSVVSC
jgi:hypothetical protein